MFYTYYIKSSVDGRIYIGSCKCVSNRLSRHNGGFVRSTKTYRPWVLLGYDEYATRSEACKQEKFLKTGQQREILKNKYKNI